MSVFTGQREPDQFERRRQLVIEDDFGRRWETTEDVTPGAGPCAPINPKGWNDPLGTPQAVLTRSLRRDADTGRWVLAMRDGYAVWRDALKQASKEYEQRLYNDAMMLFAAEGPKAYEDRSPALLNFTGEPPQAWEPVEAALQGNSAALGKKPLASDKRLAQYFVKHEPVKLNFRDEELMDLEDEHDPDALGNGKTVPVKPPKKKHEAVV